jgi:hydrogenase nickel incorporation protein HypA/HybF
MHELSIADAVVQIVERHAAGRRVTKVELRVGHLRQVVAPALEFAFELVARDTVVEGAELALTEVPAAVACLNCGHEGVHVQFPAVCERCGSLDVEIRGGDELLVEALELEEDALIATGG